MLGLLCLVCLIPWTTGSRLVVMGGSIGGTNDAVWEKFVDWCGGLSARIGVVSAASADPEDSANYYVELFTLNYGAQSAEFIPVHLGNRDANSDPAVVDQINRQTAFFFSGGDQSRITDSFYNLGVGGERVESLALQAIKQRFAAGATVGGSSAGAVCHGTAPMIAGGISYNALLFGAFERGSGGSSDLTYEAEGGLGMLQGFIVDSHVGERGREGRLVRLLADTQNRENGVKRGIGLDEGTALFISDVEQANSTGEVVGRNGVTFSDITSATVDDSGFFWAIDGVRFTYLTEDDVINLTNMQVTWASWKQNLSGNEPEEAPETSDAIFNGNRATGLTPEFILVATSLYEARQGTITNGTTERGPPFFRVDFDKSLVGSVGYAGDNPNSGSRQVGYYNLKVDMKED